MTEDEVTELFILLDDNELDELERLLTADNVNVVDAAGQSLLHGAVLNSNAEAARLLLRLGADVDARDTHGSTPLIYAASRYDRDLAKLLLKAGADPNLKGEQGMTALRWAITKGAEHRALVDLLLEHGADPWIENDAGSHAVHFAERVDPDAAEQMKRIKPKAKPKA